MAFFHSSAHNSGKTNRIFMKVLSYMYMSLDKEIPSKCWKSCGSRVRVLLLLLCYFLTHHVVLLDSLKQCQLEKTSCNETIRKLGQQLADKDAKRHVQRFHLNQMIHGCCYWSSLHITLHLESKKQDSLLMLITSQNINQF